MLKFVKQIEINLSICPKKTISRNPTGRKWVRVSILINFFEA